jgi:outer membrane receptor protein involved in Fe transport
LQAEESTALAPVEVVASRAENERLNTPASVTAYTGDFLKTNGIVDYQDLAPLVPGLFASEQAPDNVSLNIRGFTSDTSDPRVQPRVSVFQDGVRLTNAHGNNVALFDVDNIAVFKGPQPTQFGEGVESGALSLTSNRAVNESSGALSLGLGDYNAVAADAYINRPVVKDTLFLRVAVYESRHDGYVENLADGSDLQGENTVAFRTSLRWQPAPETTGDLIFNYQHDDAPGIDFKSATGIPGFPPVPNTNPYTAANLNRGSALGVTRTITGLTGILKHELNDAWTVTSTSAWRQVESRNESDADGTSLYLLELGEHFHGQQLSQQVNFSYDQGGRLTASTGVNVAWRKDVQTVFIGTDENTLFTFLTSGGIFPFPLNPRYSEHNTNESETTSGDLFGRADYKLTDKLTVGAGLRATQERIISRYQSFAATVPGNLAGALPTSGGGNNIFQVSNGQIENTADVQSWAGQLDARYAFTPHLTAYTAVSRGRQPPVLHFNEITLAPVTNNEETVWNYEAGIKGSTDNRRIRYDASVFQYYFDHFQTDRVVAPGVVAPIDGGRARGQGFETTVQGDVTRELTLFGTYGYTDAQFSGLDDDDQPQAYAGNTFRLTSLNTISVGAALSLPLSDAGTVFFTPLYTYRSAYYFEDDNAQNGGALRQGGFGLVNLRLGYRPRSLRWEVVGYVNNVFGKQYLLDSGNIGGAYGIPTSIPAAPRTVGVKATVRF